MPDVHLTPEERAEVRYSDGRPVMLREQPIESIVERIVTARLAQQRDAIANAIEARTFTAIADEGRTLMAAARIAREYGDGA